MIITASISISMHNDNANTNATCKGASYPQNAYEITLLSNF